MNTAERVGAAMLASAPILGVGFALTSSSPALAAGACEEGGFSNWHRGERTAATAFDIGSSATIEYNPFSLCHPTDGTSGASIWAMVTATGDLGYAQAGYLQRSNHSGPHFFAESNECYPGCGDPDTVILPNGPSTAHSYKVTYDAEIQRLRMWWDLQLIDITGFNPWQEWSGPVQGQFMGEVHDHGDDVPGFVSDPTRFENVQMYNFFNGWYNQSDLVPNDFDGTRHFDGDLAELSNTAYDLWDCCP